MSAARPNTWILAAAAATTAATAATAAADGAAADAPVVLQREVSHPRNVDQSTLVFREGRVEFVTNAFLRGAGRPERTPRLGRFRLPSEGRLASFRRLAAAYRRMAANRRRRSSGALLARIEEALGGRPPRAPHAPVIRLGGDGTAAELRPSHPHFGLLDRVLREAEGMEWECVSCAEYALDGDSVTRTTRTAGGAPAAKTFSKDELGCRPAGDGLECVDGEFGVFEIGGG